jgi:predicted TIM-barrel fold metal-dependent hydrolase
MYDGPIIDAHHHVWDLAKNRHPWLQDEPMIPFRYGDYSAIRSTYLPPDYRRDSQRHRVVATVYVEAEWDPTDPIGETRYISALAAAERLPNAVVAQAWLDRDDAAEVLAAQAAFPIVRSVRHKPKSASKPADAARGLAGSMDCPRWRDGFARLGRHGLHFDLQTPWWHFDAAADLARDFPGTTIIVNHTGLPSDRSAEGLAGWRTALERLAQAPNVALKISGLGLRDQPWTVANNGAIVRDAIRIFEASRCMFASNFPVDRLAGSFDDIFNGFKAITADLPANDQRALFHGTASRLYRPHSPAEKAPS